MPHDVPEGAHTLGLPRIEPQTRLRPDDKQDFDAQVAEVYRNNPQVSIRALTDAAGRSYGTIQRAVAKARA